MKICSRHLHAVVDTGLCTGCGICAGTCPKDVLIMRDGRAMCSSETECIDCGWCEEVCPSYGYELNDLYKNHYAIYEAASTNDNLKGKGSSGGVVTQMLLNAVAENYVDAVVAAEGCDSIEEGLCRYRILDRMEDIQGASGSKYVMASFDQMLRVLKSIKKRVAVVALPCQMYGITKAMEHYPLLKDNIVLKIGLFCGYTYSNACINGLSAVTGADDVKCVAGWREDGLPGFCVLQKQNGETAKISFLDEHSVDVTFYAYEKCLLCKDCFADYADLVAGDIGRGWKEKKTLVLIRSKAGVKWFTRLCGNMNIKKLRAEDWKQTPVSFLELQKRSKVSERIRIRQREKKYVPVWSGDYNERRLLFVQKMNMRKLIRKQNTARENTDQYLKEPGKMLRLGRQLYYKGENGAAVRYAGLAERALRIALQTNWLNIVRNRIPEKNRLFQSEKKYIRAGLIGLGSWGRQYVSFLRKWGGIHLLCVYDQDREICSKIAKKYQIDIRTPEEMAADEGIDTIFILTSNDMHYEQIVFMMEHKKHVFVEKPLANEYKHAKELQKMSYEKNLYLYVAHSMKMGKGFLMLKNLIQSGRLGAVRQFFCVRMVSGMNHVMRSSWRADPKRAPLLPMIQLGVHLLDASLYLFGEEIWCRSASARATCGVTESISCILENEKVTGNLMVSYDAIPAMEYVVYGTRARAVLNDKELLLVEGGKKRVLEKGLDKENLILKEIKDYYCWRMKEKEPVNTLERAVKVIEIFEDIRRMIENGENDHEIL